MSMIRVCMPNLYTTDIKGYAKTSTQYLYTYGKVSKEKPGRHEWCSKDGTSDTKDGVCSTSNLLYKQEFITEEDDLEYLFNTIAYNENGFILLNYFDLSMNSITMFAFIVLPTVIILFIYYNMQGLYQKRKLQVNKANLET